MIRRARRKPRDRDRAILQQLPYGAFKHRFAAMEVLDDEGLESIHDASMKVDLLV